MTDTSLPMRPVAERWFSLPLPVRLAFRELRGGLRGFYVFVACIALGVAVITGVGALGDTLRAALGEQGEALLGGDVAVARPHQRATPEELAWLVAQGRVSETATMRAMARRVDGSDQALVELKAADKAYPLVGNLVLSGAGGVRLSSADVLKPGGIAVDPILLERLQIPLGGKLTLGRGEFEVRAVVTVEPDKIADRMTFGPRIFISTEGLEATGLVEPGSLVQWRYALKLNGEAAGDARELTTFRRKIREALPEAGFTVRDRRDPSPSVSRTLDRIRQFLTLLGLATLLVGGVGVANAVATYVDRRRGVVAVMKSLGASGRTVLALHLVQVMAIAALGVVIGLVAGLFLPVALMSTVGSVLPITGTVSVQWRSVALATSYGLLVAALFTLWPLGRAERIRPAVLFRDHIAPGRQWPSALIMALTAGLAALLAGIAILTSDARLIATYFVAGSAGVLALFAALGTLVTWAARRMPRPRQAETALAIGNLGAPGGLTRSVVLSLGTGLSLLVAVALVNGSLIHELEERVPLQSPSYFVMDLPRSEAAAFRAAVKAGAPGAEFGEAPMLRGRLVRIAGKPVESVKVAPAAQWVLRGDRGLSYSDTVPDGSKVTSGEWWPADYAGPPLVSFEAELANGLGLKLGDDVTVNVLGRDVTARVANLREVKWESLAINFVMVFSPNTLRAAPHNLLATITLPKDFPLADEARLGRELSQAFPTVTNIRVRDAINAFEAVFTKVMVAVRLAGGVTLLAGALVLAGALATVQRRRVQQAVLLRVLGATRRRILTSNLIEHLILALAAGLIALIAGTIVAWVVLHQVMEAELVFSWRTAAEVVGLAIGLVAIFGGIGTIAALRARPMSHLRAE